MTCVKSLWAVDAYNESAAHTTVKCSMSHMILNLPVVWDVSSLQIRNAPAIMQQSAKSFKFQTQ